MYLTKVVAGAQTWADQTAIQGYRVTHAFDHIEYGNLVRATQKLGPSPPAWKTNHNTRPGKGLKNLRYIDHRNLLLMGNLASGNTSAVTMGRDVSHRPEGIIRGKGYLHHSFGHQKYKPGVMLSRFLAKSISFLSKKQVFWWFPW